MSGWAYVRANSRQALGNAAVRSLHAVRAAPWFGRWAARFVQPLGESPPMTPEAEETPPYTVLVLDAARFRGDLDLLSKASDLRFLAIDWPFLQTLLTSFVAQPRMKIGRDQLPPGVSARMMFHAAPPESAIGRERERYRAFLREFLPALFGRLGVDAVMTSDLRFRRQTDFCAVASELGYPYLLYQRESMFLAPTVFKDVVSRHKALGPFWGDAVIAQNEITKEMFLASGNLSPSQIHIVGCARMDDFLGRIGEAPPKGKKVIALFSAPNRVPDRLLRNETGSEFQEISDAMHLALRAAVRHVTRHPETELRVKIKDADAGKRGGSKIEAYQATVLDEAGETPPNVSFITGRLAAHDLILASTVVIAMQSTVVLEAAVAGRPVILPHFKFLREHPEAPGSLMYLDHHRLFDAPETESELEAALAARLADARVSADVMAARRDLFARHVSPLDGAATRRAAGLVREWAERGRERRRKTSDSAAPRSRRPLGPARTETAADA